MLIAAVLAACLQDVTVQVREAPIKEKPRIPAKTIRIAREAESFKSIGTEKAWTALDLGDGLTAYITTSAVVEREFFIPSATAGTGQGDRTETTIAARGYNGSTERQLARDENLTAEFALLDRIERAPAFKRAWDSTENDIRAFKQAHFLGEYSR
ncbi:MAG: hypothetical protein A3F84_19920 [Candidatus Handelsmanbacteria bacterium RIFCSPLOWO2_12_FULL_64_10]|uniref:SH3b domain-containing protein n=1 Tax=Handelsmanbacteria sp. (strain RIFCSPLOWO2_12_FULL_64_10) TaxID=1817868 RepID=A0A1F6D2J1_HANXR|nr:MAG: hypothetical protein A3F84_19920 [Candidatus Handelsmanbacteria bacterium RIFCSPLOWO2_12_FULL_64_10]